MHVRILGSAAGGGFPQWNCACPNCRLLRSGYFPGKPRSQAQVAISADGMAWFLLGASPDLRTQIESCPELHPRDGVRSSPISGVVLANAELDHVLGLLLLRELQPFSVYATESVIRILRESNSMFHMLNRGPHQVNWVPMRGGESFALCGPGGEKSGITCAPVSLATRYPAYVCNSHTKLNPEEASLGLIVTSDSGGRLAYFPNVPAITHELEVSLKNVDLMLFDGTFYRDDELTRVTVTGRSAREIGHIPLDGEGGSLEMLAEIKVRRKMYFHINNTNPMLNENSPEYRAVREAGWELAEDGWQATL
jgi:pyrroloquinoline quinone biosynthesis protein B